MNENFLPDGDERGENAEAPQIESSILSDAPPESPMHSVFKKNCGFFLMLAAVCGAAYAALFTKSGGLGVNVMAFSVVWLLCSFFSAKRLGCWGFGKCAFYVFGILLLALSVFMTANGFVQFVGCCGIVLLMCMMLLEFFCYTRQWGFGTYFKAVFSLVFSAFPKLPEPFIHLHSLRRAHPAENRKTKYIITGLLISIPLAAVAIFLLASADVMFSRLLDGLVFFDIKNPAPIKTALSAIAGFLVVFLFFYCIIAAQSQSSACILEKQSRKREPVIAITFISVLAVIYLTFCVIQIIYLFIGRENALPQGCTYSEYARQGFFQLLFVSALNVALVIFCSWKFKKHGLLSALLTLVSACTYIMIASSAYRMALYVDAYGLTFLRIIVLWFLALLTIIMTGTVVSIYNFGFRLFRFTLAACLSMWLVFAFAKPDRIAAEYNFARFGATQDAVCSALYELSPDAAPVAAKYESNEFGAEYSDYEKGLDMKYAYYGLRGFNLSVWQAQRAFK